MFLLSLSEQGSPHFQLALGLTYDTAIPSIASQACPCTMRWYTLITWLVSQSSHSCDTAFCNKIVQVKMKLWLFFAVGHITLKPNDLNNKIYLIPSGSESWLPLMWLFHLGSACVAVREYLVKASSLTSLGDEVGCYWQSVMELCSKTIKSGFCIWARDSPEHGCWDALELKERVKQKEYCLFWSWPFWEITQHHFLLILSDVWRLWLFEQRPI